MYPRTVFCFKKKKKKKIAVINGRPPKVTLSYTENTIRRSLKLLKAVKFGAGASIPPGCPFLRAAGAVSHRLTPPIHGSFANLPGKSATSGLTVPNTIGISVWVVSSDL